MPAPIFSQVVTASDLLMGDVVYLAADDTWTRELARAELITDEAHAQLRLLDATRQSNTVVGAYLADVPANSMGQPDQMNAHFREAFRAVGPSNYAHGKQQSEQKAAQDV